MGQGQYSNRLAVCAARPDPRKARGQRHRWGLPLTLPGAARGRGARGRRAISQWVAARREERCRHRRPPRRRLPSEAPPRRAARVLDPDDLEARAAALVLAAPAGPRGLALDGQKVNGANAHGAQAHLLRSNASTATCRLFAAEPLAAFLALGTLPDLA